MPGTVPPIPTATEPRLSRWWFVGAALLLMALAAAGLYAWQWQPDGIEGYTFAYGQLREHWRRLHGVADASLTPLEFGEQLDAAVASLGPAAATPAGWWQRRILAQRERLRRLVAQYNLSQYSQGSATRPQDGFMMWRELRGPLWIWRQMWRWRRRINK